MWANKKKVNEKKFFFLEKGSHVVQGWPKMVMTLKQLTLVPGTEIKLTFVQVVWASSKKNQTPQSLMLLKNIIYVFSGGSETSSTVRS